MACCSQASMGAEEDLAYIEDEHYEAKLKRRHKKQAALPMTYPLPESPTHKKVSRSACGNAQATLCCGTKQFEDQPHVERTVQDRSAGTAFPSSAFNPFIKNSCTENAYTEAVASLAGGVALVNGANVNVTGTAQPSVSTVSYSAPQSAAISYSTVPPAVARSAPTTAPIVHALPAATKTSTVVQPSMQTSTIVESHPQTVSIVQSAPQTTSIVQTTSQTTATMSRPAVQTVPATQTWGSRTTSADQTVGATASTYSAYDVSNAASLVISANESPAKAMETTMEVGVHAHEHETEQHTSQVTGVNSSMIVSPVITEPLADPASENTTESGWQQMTAKERSGEESEPPVTQAITRVETYPEQPFTIESAMMPKLTTTETYTTESAVTTQSVATQPAVEPTYTFTQSPLQQTEQQTIQISRPAYSESRPMYTETTTSISQPVQTTYVTETTQQQISEQQTYQQPSTSYQQTTTYQQTIEEPTMQTTTTTTSYQPTTTTTYQPTTTTSYQPTTEITTSYQPTATTTSYQPTTEVTTSYQTATQPVTTTTSYQPTTTSYQSTTTTSYQPTTEITTNYQPTTTTTTTETTTSYQTTSQQHTTQQPITQQAQINIESQRIGRIGGEYTADNRSESEIPRRQYTVERNTSNRRAVSCTRSSTVISHVELLEARREIERRVVSSRVVSTEGDAVGVTTTSLIEKYGADNVGHDEYGDYVIKRVEVPRVETVTKEIRSVERREIVTEKKVPRYEEKIVQVLVGEPRVVDVYKEVEVVQDREIKKPVKQYIDKPVNVVKEVKVVKEVEREEIVEVPGEVIEIPKKYVVDRAVEVPKYLDRRVPVVIAQAFYPIIVEDDSAAAEIDVKCRIIGFSVQHQDVYVPLPVQRTLYFDSMVTRHNAVSMHLVAGAQYNALIRELNPQLDVSHGLEIFQMAQETGSYTKPLGSYFKTDKGGIYLYTGAGGYAVPVQEDRTVVCTLNRSSNLPTADQLIASHSVHTQPGHSSISASGMQYGGATTTTTISGTSNTFGAGTMKETTTTTTTTTVGGTMSGTLGGTLGAALGSSTLGTTLSNAATTLGATLGRPAVSSTLGTTLGTTMGATLGGMTTTTTTMENRSTNSATTLGALGGSLNATIGSVGGSYTKVSGGGVINSARSSSERQIENVASHYAAAVDSSDDGDALTVDMDGGIAEQETAEPKSSTLVDWVRDNLLSELIE